MGFSEPSMEIGDESTYIFNGFVKLKIFNGFVEFKFLTVL